MHVIIEPASGGESLSRCPNCGADLQSACEHQFVCLACDYEETDLGGEAA
ncbi:hypothetical protein SAMN05880558_112141 [Aeromonas sp. RU39B]|nr:hypothetical protein [Aeromonas sp. RU39B]SIR37825.1 hypothetical protein SAMN05880558_112141 [Aeromonas sp. RU39B]